MSENGPPPRCEECRAHASQKVLRFIDGRWRCLVCLRVRERLGKVPIERRGDVWSVHTAWGGEGR